jgi:hypothetical protein
VVILVCSTAYARKSERKSQLRLALRDYAGSVSRPSDTARIEKSPKDNHVWARQAGVDVGAWDLGVSSGVPYTVVSGVTQSCALIEGLPAGGAHVTECSMSV